MFRSFGRMVSGVSRRNKGRTTDDTPVADESAEVTHEAPTAQISTVEDQSRGPAPTAES